MSISFREETEPTESTIRELATLAQALDSRMDVPVDRYISNLRYGLEGRAWVHVALASAAGELVGYKLGRSDDPREFESWRGGVRADHRRRGIATELARRQEEWCRKEGFGSLMTRTDPDNAPMLILNLKAGFVITGTFLVRGTHLNVVLHKGLGDDRTTS